jgi:hypothetical protein
LSLQPLFRILHCAFSLLFPMQMHVAVCSHPVPCSTSPWAAMRLSECRIPMRPCFLVAHTSQSRPSTPWAPFRVPMPCRQQAAVMIVPTHAPLPGRHPLSNHCGIDAAIHFSQPRPCPTLSSNRLGIRPSYGGPVAVVSSLYPPSGFQTKLNASESLTNNTMISIPVWFRVSCQSYGNPIDGTTTPHHRHRQFTGVKGRMNSA